MSKVSDVLAMFHFNGRQAADGKTKGLSIFLDLCVFHLPAAINVISVFSSLFVKWPEEIWSACETVVSSSAPLEPRTLLLNTH